MRIAIGADHAGFLMKQEILELLEMAGHEVLDLGTDSVESVDYPDYAQAVGEMVADGRVHRGLLVCGSGIGASVVANKIPGVRAGVSHDPYSAHQGVEHDDMNVLCLGARVIGSELAAEVVRIWLRASFGKEERHVRRLRKLQDVENRYFRHE